MSELVHGDTGLQQRPAGQDEPRVADGGNPAMDHVPGILCGDAAVGNGLGAELQILDAAGAVRDQTVLVRKTEGHILEFTVFG